LLLQGVFTLARGIAIREATQYWWLDLVGGTLLTALGLWVSTSDRVWNLGSRAAFILLWIGFMAIFRGVSDIAMGFSLRSMAHGDARQPGFGASQTEQQTDGGSRPLATT